MGVLDERQFGTPTSLIVDHLCYIDFGALAGRGLRNGDQPFAAPGKLGASNRPDQPDGRALDQHLELCTSGQAEPLSNLDRNDHAACFVKDRRHGRSLTCVYQSQTLLGVGREVVAAEDVEAVSRAVRERAALEPHETSVQCWAHDA